MGTEHPLKAERIRKNLTLKMLADFAGASVSTVERAERGKMIRVDSRQRLCAYLQKSAELLGLAGSTLNEERQDITHAEDGEDDDMKRREMLKLLFATGITAIASPQYALSSEPWEQLARALQRTSAIDSTTLTSLETITKNYWQLRSSLASRDVLNGVLGHLQTITQTLQYSQPDDIHKHLCSIAGEVAQIVGQMSFDMRDYIAAQSYYKVSLEAAQEAENATLSVTALGRMSFLPIYEEKPEYALLLLQKAGCIATKKCDPLVQSWLAAIEAEAHASMQQAHLCLRSLETAEQILTTARGTTDQYWTGFDQSRLTGYKGICYIHLQQPEKAIIVLNDALASAKPQATRRRATILTDLAAAKAQQGEAEAACSLASKALEMARQTRSAMVMQRIQQFRKQLEPWRATTFVKEFDVQLMLA